MDERTRAVKGLDSICKYCEEISYAVRRFGPKDAFLTDYAYQATCAFSLQQIGEIVKTNHSWLRTVDPDFPWSGYIRFRDFSAHDYHNVDFDILWTIICDDVTPIWNEAVMILERYRAEERSDRMANMMPKARKSRLFRR